MRMWSWMEGVVMTVAELCGCWLEDGIVKSSSGSNDWAGMR